MNQKQWMFVAWSPELEQIVTPYEALHLSLNQLKDDLTFQCVECHRPLLLTQPQRGFLKHPLFKRRAREDHTRCLNTLYANLTEELRLWVDTVDALTLIAATTRKLKQSLHILDITQTYFHEEIASKPTSKSRFSKLSPIDLTSAQELYKELEKTLLEVEKQYQEGWV